MTMEPNRWSQVENIFYRACDIAPHERREFITNACGNDTELATLVFELLAADEIRATCLDAGPEFRPDRSREDETGTTHVDRIGPYNIIGELGKGGMGIVYLVERVDRQYNKRMALKLVKRGMDTDEILLRFRHERQILASLEHPNIARLYDGGAADDGRPYLVMEYVKGEPITEYCDNRRLTIENRITLFMTVCKTVQFAHQHFIVHRDLKPSNILVTPDGDVRLLDFGIAKLLHPDAGSTLPVTRPFMQFATSAYASPEQLRGEQITTASDVYSLGIILYELLTGTHPYQKATPEPAVATSGSPQQIDLPSKRILATGTPEIFSHRNASRNLVYRQLKNELDTIVRTALHPELQSRYQSAEQLLRDIERYVSGHPILAKSQTPAYRLKKFIYRNRITAGAAFVVSLLTLFFLIFTLMQHQKIVRERDTAEAVAGFLEELFEASDPYARTGERLDTLRALDLVERGRERLGTLDSQPLVQARLADVLGNVYRGVGAHDSAVVMHRRALEIRRTQPRSAWKEKVTTLHYLATDYIRYGQFEEAYPLLEEALLLVPPGEAGVRGQLLQSLASVHRAKGSFNSARIHLEESISLQRSIDGAGEPTFGLASKLNDLALLLREMEEYAAAEPFAREAVEIWNAIGRDHPEKAIFLTNLGSILHHLGKLDEADKTYREALDIEASILGDDHPTIALTLTHLAELARERQDYAAGIELYREALRRISSVDPENTGVAIVTGLLANVLRENGEHVQAEINYLRSIDHMKRIFPDTHVRIGRSYVGLGLNYHAQEKYSEAEKALLEAERILSSPGNPGVDRAYAALISLYEAWDKPDRAKAYKVKLE
jgi:eukaryotic-like serine/threonine-protein kinase